MGVVPALAHHSYNMKFLVLSACVLVSCARPSFYGLVNHPNGAVVPVDEPRVAAARADHLSAVAATHGAHGHGHGHAAVHGVHHAGHAAVAHSVRGAHAVHAAHAHAAGYGHGLVSHPNGAVVPVDEPAVQAARADHLAAGGRHGGYAVHGGYNDYGHDYSHDYN